MQTGIFVIVLLVGLLIFPWIYHLLIYLLALVCQAIEYNGTGEIPNFERPPTFYADTMEEALSASADAFLGKNSYMSVVSDVIKIFENDEYTTMFYHAISNSKKEGFIGAYLK